MIIRMLGKTIDRRCIVKKKSRVGAVNVNIGLGTWPVPFEVGEGRRFPGKGEFLWFYDAADW